MTPQQEQVLRKALADTQDHLQALKHIFGLYCFFFFEISDRVKQYQEKRKAEEKDAESKAKSDEDKKAELESARKYELSLRTLDEIMQFYKS